jgi:hypothetical protein
MVKFLSIIGLVGIVTGNDGVTAGCCIGILLISLFKGE